MVYKTPPKGFAPVFSVSTCYVEYDGSFVVLFRQDHAPQGNTWALPGGKVEAGETPREGMAREIWETGLRVVSDELVEGVVDYVTYPDFDFSCHFFHLPLTVRPDIMLCSNEHKDFKWVTREEALGLPLIPGFEIHLRGQQLP